MTQKEQQTVPVVKSVNEELRQATYIVLVPDEVDLHGDIVSEDEVRKAMQNFNKFCMKANLFHMAQTDTFEFVESYCAPVDFQMDDKFIKKGTWLATIQVTDTPQRDKLWELIKSGEINGLSIGAVGIKEEIVD